MTLRLTFERVLHNRHNNFYTPVQSLVNGTRDKENKERPKKMNRDNKSAS